MKSTLKLQTLIIATLLAVASAPVFAGGPDKKKAQEKTPTVVKEVKKEKTIETKKESTPKKAETAPEVEVPTISPLMGAFESSDGFLVSIITPTNARPNEVMVTLMPPSKKNSTFCMMFAVGKVSAPTQNKITVTQFQGDSAFPAPACAITLEADKSKITLSDHSYECENMCLGQENPFVNKKPLARLLD